LHITILNTYLWLNIAVTRYKNIKVMPQYLTKSHNQMKTSFFLATFCLISLSAFIIYTKFNANNINRNGTSISISEDDNSYQLEAVYNVGNTGRVERYINRCISPNSLGKSENDYFDVTTSLTDGTVFCVKESPGKLKVEFNKRKNSTASYYRIKKMCDGVKGVLVISN
jgi:hypothetical protein